LDDMLLSSFCYAIMPLGVLISHRHVQSCTVS
jgi:hypothetical protein